MADGNFFCTVDDMIIGDNVSVLGINDKTRSASGLYKFRTGTVIVTIGPKKAEIGGLIRLKVTDSDDCRTDIFSDFGNRKLG
ncbi:hypothetical protein SDC9_122208 [bioreactor metagenome]|uniref:Uncharacterized protein n=1 Tax=bioreactor metagenome TaxID=1076179 RepID=A0A645CE34_9ZZZZ